MKSEIVDEKVGINFLYYSRRRSDGRSCVAGRASSSCAAFLIYTYICPCMWSANVGCLRQQCIVDSVVFKLMAGMNQGVKRYVKHIEYFFFSLYKYIFLWLQRAYFRDITH